VHSRNIEGRILYTSKKPERLDQPRGYESFLFTHHSDGATTLRAHCEIEEPDPTVMRDVVYGLDAWGRPADCAIRLTVGDRFMGSGWFRFGEGFIECESYGPTVGRVSQRVELSERIDGFGTHPIVADGFLLSRQAWSDPGQRRSLSLYLPSPDHRGATPPFLAKVDIAAEFLGHERVEVAAGTFDARRFQFVDDGTSGMAGQHPPYELWITDDEDGVFLKGGVGGYMMTWYELVELRR
jgi:hypothetical protein